MTRRTALVTGASAGIGRAAASALAVAGMRVVVVARRGAALETLMAGWPQAAAEDALAIPADLLEDDAVGQIGAALEDEGVAVDVLVQAAGGSRPVPAVGADEVWRDAMALNFTAVRRLAERLVPGMTERGWGRIISVTGSSEPKPMPLDAAEGPQSALNAANAAKAAVHAWSKGLSRELGAHGITVNSIAPGRVFSEQIERIHPEPAARQAYAAEHIPVGRFGTPEEVAALIVFLTTPQAGYITGEIIHVDGGMRRHAF